jgi:hypothetical protein
MLGRKLQHPGIYCCDLLACGGEFDSGRCDNDEGKGKAPEPAETEFSMNVGVQFGLTDATSDTALKFQGSVSF